MKHQRKQVIWGAVALVVIVAIVVAIVITVKRHHDKVLASNSVTIAQTDPNLKTFYGFDQGYSFAYPKTFDALGPDANGTVTLTIPKSFQPHSDFDGATLTINASLPGDTAANAACVAPMATGTSGLGMTINGSAYNVTNAKTDKTATKTYRTVSNNRCYTIQYVIDSHKGYAGFDPALVTNILEGIVNTVKLS